MYVRQIYSALDKIRRKLGLSIEQFCLEIGITTEEWSDIRDNRPISDKTLDKAFKYLIRQNVKKKRK